MDYQNYMRPLQKGIFLPPALFANAHLLLNKLRFAAELNNKGTSEQISFASPISPWRDFENAEGCFWYLSLALSYFFISFNAVFASVFAQKAQYDILI